MFSRKPPQHLPQRKTDKS